MNIKEFQELLMTAMSSYRRDNNLTQDEISKRIGISRSYYSDIENGKKLPSPNVLNKINNTINFFYIRMTPIERGQRLEEVE